MFCTLLYFIENIDNFKARTERVNFGLFSQILILLDIT